MMRLKTPLVDLCQAAIQGRLDTQAIDWDDRAAVGIVMAAGGYPDSYNKGDVISFPAHVAQDSKVFHAGTGAKAGEVVTAGGRVLCVTALGTSVTEAQQKAYALVKQINWDNVYFRTDIAHRAIAREQSSE